MKFEREKRKKAFKFPLKIRIQMEQNTREIHIQIHGKKRKTEIKFYMCMGRRLEQIGRGGTNMFALPSY